MIRLRGSYLLLLAVGLLGTVITFAVLVPKLAHLAGPVTPIPGAAAAHVHGRHGSHHGWLTFGHVLLIFAVSGLLSMAAFAWWAVQVVRRRLGNRLARGYGLYEVKLSMHDQARGQDVTDMTEALLNAVREFAGGPGARRAAVHRVGSALRPRCDRRAEVGALPEV